MWRNSSAHSHKVFALHACRPRSLDGERVKEACSSALYGCLQRRRGGGGALTVPLPRSRTGFRQELGLLELEVLIWGGCSALQPAPSFRDGESYFHPRLHDAELLTVREVKVRRPKPGAIKLDLTRCCLRSRRAAENERHLAP